MLALFAESLVSPRSSVQAQTSAVGYLQLGGVSALSQCAWPTYIPTTGIHILAACPVDTGTIATSGVAYAIDGSATFAFPNNAAGVTSFNGRTGAVLPKAGDYTGLITYPSDLVNAPTKLTCTNTTSGCTTQ
jgi:hypothetical protein